MLTKHENIGQRKGESQFTRRNSLNLPAAEIPLLLCLQRTIYYQLISSLYRRKHDF